MIYVITPSDIRTVQTVSRQKYQYGRKCDGHKNDFPLEKSKKNIVVNVFAYRLDYSRLQNGGEQSRP